MSAPEVVQVILPPPTTVDLIVAGGLDQVSEWGLITGNLPDQTDLQTALDAKLDISRIVNDIDLLGGTVLTLSHTYHDTFNTNRTLTFAGTPLNGDIETRLRMYVISPITLTFPSSYRISQLTNPITTLDFPPGYHEMSWSYAGGIFWLLDDADSSEGLASWGSITGDITDQTDLVSYVATHGGSFISANTARVDPSGNDSTGTFGDLTKPFLTCTAAKNAAISGDTILVFAGTYAERNLLKNGVNWYFYPGAKVTITTAEDEGTPDSPVGAAIFDDSSLGSNGAVICTIGGYGEFRRNISGTSVEEVAVAYITNSGSDVSITCNTITGGDNTRTAVWQRGGKLILHSENVTAVASGHDCVYWTNGDLFLDAKILRTDSTDSTPGDIRHYPIALYIDTSIEWTTGSAWVNADHISSLGSPITSFPIYSIGSADARVWINAKLIEGPNNSGIWILGTKTYIVTEKITGGCSVQPIGELWVNTQKWDGFISNGGGTLHATIQTMELTTDPTGDFSGAGIVSCSGGDSTIEVGNLLVPADASGSPYYGLQAFGTEICRLLNTKINASASATGNPIILSGTGNVTLQNVVLVAYSGQDTIFASSAQTVNVDGTLVVNNPVNANITLSQDGLVNVVPAGGTTGQTLSKLSNTNFDTHWATPVGSGTVTQFNFTNSTGITGTVTNATTTPTLSLALTNAAVGLSSVTNDTQTKSAIVPNTAPTAGQLLAGNAGGTAYAPVTLSGSGATATLSSAGVLTLSAIPNATLSNSAITIAGTSTSLGGTITLDTISGVSSNGFLKRIGANTWTNDSSTYITGNQTITLSGDITGSGATAITTTLANIPDLTPAVGSILHTNIAAPTSPASGKVKVFTDSTDLRFHDKNSAGTIGTTVVADAGSSNNFLTAISTAGAISKAQPSFTNLSGAATTAQAGVPTGGTTGQALTKSSNSDYATTWTTLGGGSGTVTSVATTSPISGGTITTTGTISLLTNVDFGFTAGQTITEAVGISALTLTGATQTASHPVINATQTWNNSGVTFTGILANITSTASASASLLMDLQVSASSKFKVDKTGLVTASSNSRATYFQSTIVGGSSGGFLFDSRGQIYGGGSDGILVLTDYNTAATFNRLDFGGTTSSYPAIKRNSAAFDLRLADDSAYANLNLGTVKTYNAVSTAGLGVPAIYKAGRVTAQSAANSNISQFTVGAADGSFEVSMNMNVTAATVLSTSLNCDYTDESNTARTMIFPTTSLSGTFLSGGLITATGAFETPAMHIRCKASTTITLYTAAGTFTSVTYTAEGIVKQTV